MSKRTKKDIKNTSAEIGSVESDGSGLSADQSLSATLSVESTAGKKKSVRKTAKTAVLEQPASAQDDLELEKLLLQVDTMLTEMTQSKWLSSDWPSLEIDLGNKKK